MYRCMFYENISPLASQCPVLHALPRNVLQSLEVRKECTKKTLVEYEVAGLYTKVGTLRPGYLVSYQNEVKPRRTKRKEMLLSSSLEKTMIIARLVKNVR